MAAPGILDAEAEGRRIEAADQPVDDSDVWIDHFGPPQLEVADDQPVPTTDGGRRLRPQSTSATDPVGLNAAQPIINLGVDGPSMPESRPPGINTRTSDHQCNGWAPTWPTRESGGNDKGQVAVADAGLHQLG